MNKEKLTWEVLNTWKLWQLLELALQDFAKFEADPICRVNMSRFLDHFNNPDCGPEVCYGCFAGAVLRFTLGVKSMAHWTMEQMLLDRHDARHWLYAIDKLRTGDVLGALRNMDRQLTQEDLDLNRRVTSYDEDKEIWRNDMYQLLTELKTANI